MSDEYRSLSNEPGYHDLTDDLVNCSKCGTLTCRDPGKSDKDVLCSWCMEDGDEAQI